MCPWLNKLAGAKLQATTTLKIRIFLFTPQQSADKMSEMLQQPLPLLKMEPAAVATPAPVSAAPNSAPGSLAPLVPVSQVIGTSINAVVSMVGPPSQPHLQHLDPSPDGPANGIILGVPSSVGAGIGGNMDHLNGNSNDSTTSQEVQGIKNG